MYYYILLLSLLLLLLRFNEFAKNIIHIYTGLAPRVVVEKPAVQIT